MTKISILHPSRSRPLKSFDTLTQWVNKADNEVEVIVSLDDDDPKRMEYNRPVTEGRFIVNNNRSAVDAINRAAEVCTGDILIVVSDDTGCFQGWDTALLKVVEGRKDWILKCQDGIQPWIITMPVMDRTYYNRFGYVYYPEFRHLFCDTFMTCVADLLGRKIVSDLMFPHLHYSTGKTSKDAINDRADKTWNQGLDLMIELASKGWLLQPSEIKGYIQDKSIEDLIKKRLTNRRR
jgi:hypothetical protein